ncbi:4-hydroxy-3-methylbut-2-enyl diphosphate reductase [Streptomyces sp. NPDC007205]|uniref:4-hydroxy-3-methylbut-2-enyl diphosphate reductase n=1 Tax=Streptomyces sp. NPDC007205 TaxID=3154316 RepID=UPI0033DF523F
MNALDKRVLLAAPRGFCAGVIRAIQTVEAALERYGPPVYVRHEIVHNKHVVRTLEKKGVVFVEEAAQVPEGAAVIFSAHGVAPAVHEEAARQNLTTIDATCPLVTKVHKEAVRFAQQDYDILLVGHQGHEEVTATLGHAPHRIQLVDGPADVAHIEVRDPRKVVWLSQTTLSGDETMETVHALKEKFPGLVSPPSDDICYATQNRQLAVKQLAAEAELVIVIGSRNSSNSERLVDVAVQAGANAAHLVDSADEIDEAWLQSVTTVGVTSGASAPEILVEGVLDWLAAWGFTDVSTITAAKESLTFSLPQELRTDRRVQAPTPRARTRRRSPPDEPCRLTDVHTDLR